MLIFIQEHWLANYEAEVKLSTNFPQYNFSITSSDIFTPAEDKMLESGPTWHGAAVGWDQNVEKHITRIPIISERFSGINYTDGQTNIIAYSAYLPTSGQDDEYLEVLSLLSYDIRNNRTENSGILIGLDTNQSEKSSRRRIEAMKQFCEQFCLKGVLTNSDPTFHHNNQTSSSQIDNILAYFPKQSPLKISLFKHLCKLDYSANLSSHDVLIAKLVTPAAEKKIIETDYSHTYEPFIVQKPRWDKAGIPGYQSETAKVLKNLLIEFNEPEYIPLLSELFSKMLVISAKNNFETHHPKMKSSGSKIFFSPEHKEAYRKHENICKEWRRQGRPKDPKNFIKQLKLESQRNLQRISRQDEALKAHKDHDELMTAFVQNINQIYKKLKKIRGENIKFKKISEIETLSGTYSGDNILEGFCANTETLCRDESKSMNHEFYKMCEQDNMIILEISQNENLKIPHMNIQNLTDILFKRLKLNKACDIYKLSVEHLRYAGEETLSSVVGRTNL